MAKISEKDKAHLMQLVAQGHSDEEIAKILKWKNKGAVRSVSEQRRTLSKMGRPSIDLQVNLDQMTKEERFNHISSRFGQSPRTIFVINSFSKEERALFNEEYFRVLRATDSITEAEEQQLFTTMLEFVLAMKALRLKTQEEDLYDRSMRGEIPSAIQDPNDFTKTIPNPMFRHQIDPRFESEYNSHIKNYEKFMDALKMSRKQRLDKIQQDRKSLVDVAMYLSSKDAQNAAADEIARLTKMQNSELREMISNGYLLGVFEEK